VLAYLIASGFPLRSALPAVFCQTDPSGTMVLGGMSDPGGMMARAQIQHRGRSNAYHPKFRRGTNHGGEPVGRPQHLRSSLHAPALPAACRARPCLRPLISELPSRAEMATLITRPNSHPGNFITMNDKPILYGFDGSTYVRTVRMVLKEKGVEYEQVPVNVLAGEPRQPEHLARHPFGKVPVLDIDGMRLRETDAICRYLDEARSGPSFVPDDPKDRARMNQAISLINSYGYGALVGVAGYHLFPDFIGGANDEARTACLGESEKLLKLLMEIKGDDPWIAGSKPSLADFLLAPILFYVSLTPDSDRILGVPGVSDWWAAINGVESFKATEPDLG